MDVWRPLEYSCGTWKFTRGLISAGRCLASRRVHEVDERRELGRAPLVDERRELGRAPLVDERRELGRARN